MISGWLFYLSLGAAAGVLAGLFGVGGGAIIVPMLIFAFSAQSFAAESLVHIAVGTSFATMVVTSLSSVVAHHKLGNVRWPVFRNMLPGLIGGVIAGSILAASVSGANLEQAISLFLMLVALQMFFAIQPPGVFGLPGRWVQMGAGGFIGGLSAFFGIGGGSLTVPYLSACREPMKNAIATSAVCGFPIAVFGALAYCYQGLGSQTLPEWSTGYIYWPAFIGIAVVSTPCAKLGAILAARLPDRLLKKSFAVMLASIGYLLFSR